MWDLFLSVWIELCPVVVFSMTLVGSFWYDVLNKILPLWKVLTYARMRLAALKCPSLGAMLNLLRDIVA